MRPVPRAARLLHAADPLRQAGHRALRPRGRPAEPRDADGRRPGGDGRRRLGAGGALRLLRGWPDVRALRGHVPGADDGAHHCRQLRAPDLGARLPLGAGARGSTGSCSRRCQRRVGRARGPRRRAAPSAAGGRARPPVVGALPADGREPGRRRDAAPDELRRSTSGTCCRPSACRRSSSTALAIGRSPSARSRFMAERIPGAKFVELPGVDHSPGGKTRTRSSTRSRSSSRASGTAPSPTACWPPSSSPTSSAPRRRPPPSATAAGATSSSGTTTSCAASSGASGAARSTPRATGSSPPSTGPRAGSAAPARSASGVRALGLEVRAGLHTGEVELLDDKVSGLAVHIGARVAAAAGPGEVLVSSTVKDLVAGSGLRFQDRGLQTLKGVPGEWHLFALERKAGAREAPLRLLRVGARPAARVRRRGARAGRGAPRPGTRPGLRRRVGRADGDPRGRRPRRGRRGDRRPAEGPRAEGAAPTAA